MHILKPWKVEHSWGGRGWQHIRNNCCCTPFGEVYFINVHQSLQCPKMWSGIVSASPCFFAQHHGVDNHPVASSIPPGPKSEAYLCRFNFGVREIGSSSFNDFTNCRFCFTEIYIPNLQKSRWNSCFFSKFYTIGWSLKVGSETPTLRLHMGMHGMPGQDGPGASENAIHFF